MPGIHTPLREESCRGDVREIRTRYPACPQHALQLPRPSTQPGHHRRIAGSILERPHSEKRERGPGGYAPAGVCVASEADHHAHRPRDRHSGSRRGQASRVSTKSPAGRRESRAGKRLRGCRRRRDRERIGVAQPKPEWEARGPESDRRRLNRGGGGGLVPSDFSAPGIRVCVIPEAPSDALTRHKRGTGYRCGGAMPQADASPPKEGMQRRRNATFSESRRVRSPRAWMLRLEMSEILEIQRDAIGSSAVDDWCDSRRIAGTRPRRRTSRRTPRNTTVTKQSLHGWVG